MATHISVETNLRYSWNKLAVLSSFFCCWNCLNYLTIAGSLKSISECFSYSKLSESPLYELGIFFNFRMVVLGGNGTHKVRIFGFVKIVFLGTKFGGFKNICYRKCL